MIRITAAISSPPDTIQHLYIARCGSLIIRRSRPDVFCAITKGSWLGMHQTRFRLYTAGAYLPTVYTAL